MGSCVIILTKTAAISLPWMGVEPGLPSLPILRSEPRSGDDRVGDQRRFCNIVGGVISPLLANIYMDRLDKFVEQTLIPEFTSDSTRREKSEYKRLKYRIYRLKKAGAK